MLQYLKNLDIAPVLYNHPVYNTYMYTYEQNLPCFSGTYRKDICDISFCYLYANQRTTCIGGETKSSFVIKRFQHFNNKNNCKQISLLWVS